MLPLPATLRTLPLDHLDPTVAGGDDFDLATLGVTRARYVWIQDTGLNKYAPPSGGFDLDAIERFDSQQSTRHGGYTFSTSSTFSI